MNPTTSQLQLPVLIKTEPLAIIKDEPAESEIVENSMDDIPYSPRIIPDIKDLDSKSHTLCDDSIKSETVPEYVFETVFVKTEDALFVKEENITESKRLNKTEDTSNGNGQEVVDIQGEVIVKVNY